MQTKQAQYSTESKLYTDLGSNFPDVKLPYGFNTVEHFSSIGFLREWERKVKGKHNKTKPFQHSCNHWHL